MPMPEHTVTNIALCFNALFLGPLYSVKGQIHLA